MPLQWSDPDPLSYDPLANPVEVHATKNLGGGNSAFMSFTVDLGVEGPSPTEETALGWLEVLYDALVTAGWTTDLRMWQAAVSRRYVEEA